MKNGHAVINVIFHLIRVSLSKCGEKGETKLQEGEQMMFHHSTAALEMTKGGGAVWHHDDL